MSFSSDIKQELNKTSNLANKELVKYELIGYLISGNIDVIGNNKIKFSTESDYNINRFSKLLSNLNINHQIDIVGKNFVITAKIGIWNKIEEVVKIKDTVKIEDENKIKNENKIEILDKIEIKQNTIYLKDITEEKQENLKSIIRGLFLGAGSINNPERKYHLEIVLSNIENMKKIVKILGIFDIKVKTLETQNKYSIYIKESEEISKFLALIGASKAVLKFEDIRIQKQMRGKVNRLVNCETANLNKTINASIEQIEAIEKIQKAGKFNKLDDNLKEIAILRLENPDMSLIDLGKKLKTPIGKSGVNYRLKRIMEIAKNL